MAVRPTGLLVSTAEEMPASIIWRTSTRREEYFGPLGITGRTFIDPDKSNRVGLIVECPSLEAFQQALQGEAAADAMKFDGVRPETLQMFVEG
jgi:hypothetical protein